MKRYKVTVDIILQARSVEDAVWLATAAAISGKTVVGCSAEAQEQVESNCAVTGPNAVKKSEWVPNKIKKKKERLERGAGAGIPESIRNPVTGKARYNAPVIATRVDTGEEERYATISIAARKIGVHPVSVGKALRGKLKTTCRRTWRYADE
jgi:hypothetical protein